MKLVKYDKSKLERNIYKKSNLLLVIEEFTSSDMDCAKIEGWTHHDAHSCANAFNMAIKRYRVGNVRAMVRKGEVYLVKEI